MNPGNYSQCNTNRRSSRPSSHPNSGNNSDDNNEDDKGCNRPNVNISTVNEDTHSLGSLEESTSRPSINTNNFRHLRAGSWSGVNESEDELEQLTQNLQRNPLLRIDNGMLYQDTVGNLPQHNYGAMEDSIISFPVSTVSSSNTIPHRHSHALNIERMRRRLKFFFMDPIEKWHARRRFPWKLLVQVIKIFIVTTQLCMFASQRYSHVNYLWDTKISFSHLFIKGWDSSREINAYPPSLGALAVYQRDEFFSYIDYAIQSYSNISIAIGSYNYAKKKNNSIISPKFCALHYLKGQVASEPELSYYINNDRNLSCIDIPSSIVNSSDWCVQDYLEKNNFSVQFDSLLEAYYEFKLQTVKLRINLPYNVPECYTLSGKVYFDNHDHDGQMLVDMDVSAQVLKCNGTLEITDENKSTVIIRNVVNASTISICALSLIMCIRAIYRALILRKATAVLFKRHFNTTLSFDENSEFINLWYVMICFNDILIILGSILKIGLESKVFMPLEKQDYEGFLDTWNICSLLLGMGNMLVWFGCLRYLSFHETYNVLILTIKNCIPKVLRYSICILMVFFGYCLCGWLVLGPYHLKFRSFSSTMECLYSLVNGDDMFATFSSTSGKDPLVWWFSRIYLYSFISLFIYVILSLFIAIIMDAYETIKKYYEVGFPLSPLMQFVNQCTEDATSGAYLDEGDRTIHDIINKICCCGQSEIRREGEGYEPIVT